jgi:hypothetical protein
MHNEIYLGMMPKQMFSRARELYIGLRIQITINGCPEIQKW